MSSRIYGETGLGAWTQFTPSFTSTGGAFTSTNVDGYYRRVGKTINCTVFGQVVTLGASASGAAIFGLPFTAANVTRKEWAATGRERGTKGWMFGANISPGATTVSFFKWDNTGLIDVASGQIFICTFTYEVP